jgi:beta-fructofuranosidase
MSAPSSQRLESSSTFRRFSDGQPVGDVIPFFHGGQYHLFILTPPSGSLHFPERLVTTWRHITSTDLVHWVERGDAIEPGAVKDFDGGGIWTGSAIFLDGIFHIYYTGHGTDHTQVICHATSTDGLTWQKADGNPVLAAPHGYEAKDWRDPFVFWHADENCYWMLITARSSMATAPNRGLIAVSRSLDLSEWSAPETFYSTFLTHAPECPEIFELDGKWVLGYSRFTDRRGTVYRVADHPSGPYRTLGPEAPDAANWYAAKGLSTPDGRRISFGWVPDHDPELVNPANPWLWAGDLALPRELHVNADGEVHMSLPPEIRSQFGADLPFHWAADDGKWSSSGETIKVSAKGDVAIRTLTLEQPAIDSVLSVQFAELDDIHQVGLIVHTTEKLDSGIGIFYFPRTGNVRAVDMRAPVGEVSAEYETMFGQYAPIAEHDLSHSRDAMRFEVVTRGDVVEAFVGDVCCLTYRTKGTGTPAAALVAVDGTATITEYSWRNFGL